MQKDNTIEQALQRLQKMRRERDFDGQLDTYMELGRIMSRQKWFSEAVDYFKKAVRVAKYLNKAKDQETIFQQMLAIYEIENDREAIVDLYGLMHIHFNLIGDYEKAMFYNNRRLELVARQIGKIEPSCSERFEYESMLAEKHIELEKSDTCNF